MYIWVYLEGGYLVDQYMSSILAFKHLPFDYDEWLKMGDNLFLLKDVEPRTTLERVWVRDRI